MTVAATVVAKVQRMADWVVATVDVPAKGSSAALAQSVQGSYLPTIGTIIRKVFPIAFQNMGYFISSGCHYTFL